MQEDLSDAAPTAFEDGSFELLKISIYQTFVLVNTIFELMFVFYCLLLNTIFFAAFGSIYK